MVKSSAAPFIKGDWPKSVFLADPATDNLMSALLQLGTEFWTLRRRLLVVETLLDERGSLDREAIETYHPNALERSQWDRERDDFITRVFTVLVRETADTRGRFPPDADDSSGKAS